MGSRAHCFRLSPRICLRTPKPILHVPSTGRPGQTRGPSVHYPRTSGGKSDCTSATRKQIQRFLFQPFHCSQEGRIVQTCFRPKAPQHIPAIFPVQDGITTVRHSRHDTKRIPGNTRHKGRLPPCPHFPSTLEVLTICLQEPALPIHLPSLRSDVSTQDLYQDHGSGSGSTKVPGGLHHPLPGRPSAQGSHSTSGDSTALSSIRNPDQAGVENQHYQVTVDPCPTHAIPGHDLRHKATKDISTTGEDHQITRHDTASPPHEFSSHPSRNASPRVNGLYHRGRTIRPVPPARTTVEHPGPVEADKSVTTDTHPSQNQNRTVMVVRQHSPFQGSLTHRAALASSNNGRQPQGVGCSSTPTNNSRNMVDSRVPASHKYFGDQSGAPSLITLASAFPGTSSQDPVRQRHRCSIPQPSGGHEEPTSIEGGQHDPILGGVMGRTAFSSVHTRPRKLASRLSQQTKARSRGMGSKSQGVSGYHRQVGSPGSGPYGLSNEPPSTPLHGQMPRSHGNRGRCSDRRLELFSSLCLSSTSTHTKSTPEDQKRGLPSNSDSTLLAQKDMVHRPDVPQQGPSLSSPLAPQPAHAGSDPTPESSIPEFNGLALESLVLSRRGFSTEVIQTMMAARRPVSAKTYHRVWRIYQEWCQSQGQPFQDFSVPRLLSFLQSGLDKGLSLGSLKSQISALSVLFQQRIASLPDVRTFLQGVSRLHPPFRDPTPPWDLNLVLTALQTAPFEPLATIPLAWVTWKTAFLLAITSARRVSELSSLSSQPPYLIFHEDRTVLRTIPSFTPKVISAFHINQDITIPSFCPNPKTPKEVALHSLDPVRALKFYLHRTKDIRSTNSLFVLHSGPQKGSPASKTTVSRWIKEAIRRAYIARGKSPPLRI
uniref:Core-binding (CB) domain-containing protein n=1 Tax=Xenopus tropicalis TaxID=8364 RepID=A0A6I8RJ21_XENTR